jgi:hypothetical protein
VVALDTVVGVGVGVVNCAGPRCDVLKRFIRAVLAYVLISGAVQLAGRYLSRRLAEGDEHSNEFRIAAITSGTMLGGVDLRIPDDNQLSDEAPLLRVQATARFGGTVVTSPQ